ncbi:26S proteasome non-ATPase regulatory subunit 9 [Capronia epimyces CBS 606.96]|uniref:Probable 26S proteasome regulatory subunit p27 n=1 Tax=Capronia epimyces CBS 606.96 TaxID=1182542 RepID=W9ZDR9_9EURO|nr:26S proteasome non-ATPase regulatory subunit 9 [Capronia epimyces CBS 606.96]EXJ92669.1 26S proteasome non-ATPase regulatory subunit 9 [Capronia epimyces CBS 606.96]
MGLPMDPNLAEIHVPSGPTSIRQAESFDGLTLQQLISRKDDLEAELKALGAVLDSHGVTMDTSLTTFDGYPRSDIDVAQVRVTRARIIALRNDWKALMDKIEKGLHEHHAKYQASDAYKNSLAQPQPESAPSSSQTPAIPETPFAKVSSVEPGSPANEAGLKAGDLIRRFGSVIWSNHERLRKVGEAVSQNLGRPILVKVARGNGPQAQELDLRVTPRGNWGGRGTLGCHIVPV